MQRHIQVDTRIQNLGYSEPWKLLSEKEKNYAYFLSKASWAGAKMVLHQLCYEAPGLFLLFQAYFQEKDFFKLEQAASAAGVSADEYKQFIAYAGGFYGNMSNYHSFGDMKFIPELSKEKFLSILKSNPLYNDADAFYKEVVDTLWPQLEKEIFDIDKPYTQLNFPEDGGITGYFGRNCTKADLDVAKSICDANGIDILNTRVFKKAEGHLVVTVGSVQKQASKKDCKHTDDKTLYDIVYGEFSSYLEEANVYMKEALKYVANDVQKTMIEKYIESFDTGDIEAHKDSQRSWVKDKGPVVESNLGWIETYVDPANVRAYWEGMVAIVDKDQSAKFQALVKASETIIPLLPWPKEMEKENFLAPDFTALVILTFASNSCPLGINIPNYDDIRESEGFKNVFLINSMPSYTSSAVQFATEEQAKILSDNTFKCYQVHVACHELLGHGVGKLIYRGADGKAPKFTDPITGEEFESCYEENEGWNTKFGAISTSYEECRADTCGFYLCTLKEVYTLFGFADDEVDTMLWCNVMNQLRKGVLGLTLYNPETKKWGQAHTQGAFVFAMWLYKNQKSKIVDFKITDDGNDFFFELNKENLVAEGKELIKQLLVVIQTYKSSGASDRGTKFYNEYSEVSDFFLKVREIVVKQKKPRRVELNNNLMRYSESCIEPVNYPETFEGICMSYADRFQFNRALYKQVMGEWDQHKADLKV